MGTSASRLPELEAARRMTHVPAWCGADGRRCVRTGSGGNGVHCFPSSHCGASTKGDASVDKSGLVVETDYFIQLYSSRPDVCPHRYLSIDKKCSASLPRLSADPFNQEAGGGRQQRWRLSRAVAGNSTYYIRPSSCPLLRTTKLAAGPACSPLLSASAAPQAGRTAWLFKPAGQHKRFHVELAGTKARSCGRKLLSPRPGATCNGGPVLLVDRKQTTLGRQLHTLRFIKVDDDRGIAERYSAHDILSCRRLATIPWLPPSCHLFDVNLYAPVTPCRYFARQQPLVLAAARRFVVHPYFERLAKLYLPMLRQQAASPAERPLRCARTACTGSYNNDIN